MSEKISIQYYTTPVGELILGACKGQLCLADWRYRRMRNAVDNRLQKYLKAEYVEQDDPVIEQTRQQLEEYFNQERTTFDIPLLLAGSVFQQTVWKALIEIPYGETSTYLKLSQQLQNEKAIRAVASANGANAISILVPCHRIIGSNGDLVGYAGGLPAKKKLLDLECALETSQLSLF